LHTGNHRAGGICGHANMRAKINLAEWVVLAEAEA
jgi:hypothetical protein